jgi:uncharacterized coiled-coil protein SlyX
MESNSTPDGTHSAVESGVESVRPDAGARKRNQPVSGRRANPAEGVRVRGGKNGRRPNAGAPADASRANGKGKKKRGRPSNAERAARERQARAGQSGHDSGDRAATPDGPVDRLALIHNLSERTLEFLLNQSRSSQQHTRTLEAQVVAQQTTIEFLERQLAITQRNQDQLLARVLGQPIAPASTQMFADPAFHNPPPSRAPMTVHFEPPHPELNGPSLPMPQGAGARRQPTAKEVAELYGEEGGGVFDDMGDDKARELGLDHDDVTGTVQRGKRQPTN